MAHPVSLHHTFHSLSLSYDLFIDGREVPAVSGSYFEARHLLVIFQFSQIDQSLHP
jgi:hypothetical protein